MFTDATAPTCDGILVDNNAMCIYIANVPSTWEDAKNGCQMTGGQFVSLLDNTYESVIISLLQTRSNTGTAWLGGRREDNINYWSQLWRWASGKQPTLSITLRTCLKRELESCSYIFFVSVTLLMCKLFVVVKFCIVCLIHLLQYLTLARILFIAKKIAVSLYL